jgi:hypothetical protein
MKKHVQKITQRNESLRLHNEHNTYLNLCHRYMQLS